MHVVGVQQQMQADRYTDTYIHVTYTYTDTDVNAPVPECAGSTAAGTAEKAGPLRNTKRCCVAAVKVQTQGWRCGR
jgi:hypothetical protein